jgi:hypothetical protein
MILKRQKASKKITLGLIFFTAAGVLHPEARAQITLGTADAFSVLAGTTVINTGFSVIDGGNVGVSPGSAIVGFPPGVVVPPYVLHPADGVALQAQTDLTTAYNSAAGLSPNMDLTGQDLGGLTLVPGVYSFSSSAQLTGPLTLNYLGNPDAQFVFQIGSTLTTASASSVLSLNGGLGAGCNVFWQVGSSATLGTATAFTGHILALADITLTTGASLDGSALARNGRVTLDNNRITNLPCDDQGSTGVPDAGTTMLLLACASAPLLALSRRHSRK